MKIIKKSQLALLSLSLMIMIAGYINYKYDPQREKNLGQTVRVNSGDVFLYNYSEDGIDTNVSIYDEANKNNDTLYNKKVTNTLATFKEQRDNMFSELEETYIMAINNVDNEAKVKYQEKLDVLISKKHLINIVEDLIKSKGIDGIAIIPTGENINVVIDATVKLTDTQVALIQKIIQDEFEIKAGDITITQQNIETN